jgi:hypothetical protein
LWKIQLTQNFNVIILFSGTLTIFSLAGINAVVHALVLDMSDQHPCVATLLDVDREAALFGPGNRYGGTGIENGTCTSVAT